MNQINYKYYSMYWENEDKKFLNERDISHDSSAIHLTLHSKHNLETAKIIKEYEGWKKFNFE